MIGTILSIAAGGALGAVARYSTHLAALKLLGDEFPWGTLIVNVLGSALMGALVIALDHIWQTNQSLKLLLLTGFLGAFTTFSTFSLDVATLYERGAFVPAVAYLAGSVILSITALVAAMTLTRSILS